LASPLSTWNWPRRYAAGRSGTARRGWCGRPPTAKTAAGRVTGRISPRAWAERGLFGLHLPEDAGGQGYGLPELAVVLEETGRALLPGAFLPTDLASAVLGDAVPLAGADESPGAAAPAGATATAQASGAGQAGSTAAKLIARLADGSLAGAVCLATGLTGIRGADGGLTVSGGCSACRATPSRPPSPSPSGRREIDASRASQSGSYRPCAAGAANLSWRACMGG